MANYNYWSPAALKSNTYRHTKTTKFSTPKLKKLDLNQKNPFKNIRSHTLEQCVASTSQVKAHVSILKELFWISEWHAPVFCTSSYVHV